MKGILIRHNKLNAKELRNKIESASGPVLQTLLDAHILSTEELDNIVKKRIVDRIGVPKIGTCVLILTEQCNLRCRYCFIEKNLLCKQIHESMTPQIAQRAIQYFSEQLSPDVEPSFIIYGGEPLLNWKSIKIILETIDSLKELKRLPSNCHISINTNGTLITDEIAKTLSKYGVTVSISIDGNRAQNIDRVCANGTESFDCVLEGIQMCRDHNVKFGISITATPKMISQFGDAIDFVVNLKPAKVGINPLLAAGELYSDYGKDLCNMMIHAMKTLNENDIEEDRLTDRISYLKSRHLKYYDCSATKGEQIVITPDGKVGICHEFIGSRDFFISDIWCKDRLSDNTVMRQWMHRTPFTMDKCEGCMALGVCGGGCPANAFNIYGNIMEMDTNCCSLSKKLVEWYFTEYSIPEEIITL